MQKPWTQGLTDRVKHCVAGCARQCSKGCGIQQSSRQDCNISLQHFSELFPFRQKKPLQNARLCVCDPGEIFYARLSCTGDTRAKGLRTACRTQSQRLFRGTVQQSAAQDCRDTCRPHVLPLRPESAARSLCSSCLKAFVSKHLSSKHLPEKTLCRALASSSLLFMREQNQAR